MFNFDYITKEDRKEHNLNWSKVPGNPNQKTSALLNIINKEPDINKIYI